MKKRMIRELRRKAVLLALVSGLFCGSSGMVYAAEESTETEKSQFLNYLSERGQPGDYNGDGVINVFDLMKYKNSFIEEKEFYSTGESAIDVNKVQPWSAVL
ncbi:dockerin type I domain-containing protein [Ruminococcus sp. HUN007]|uniref:dockerin type I domain-containing protein n=1 Tax=Ruminococcus sp. HUN007 TaxID=1514668 RepID=UPI0005D17769|nr:dockerin type I domain-containing protein [Ruminococcus sp. HUN007]